MQRITTFAAAAVLALGSAHAQSILIPSNVTAGADGPGSTSYPWNRDGATASSNDIRVQYVYDRSNFAGITSPIIITQLAFRAQATATPWTGGTYSNCEVRIGSAVAPGAVTTTFAANYASGVEPAPAYTGPVTVLPDPAPQASPAPGIFYVTISGLSVLYDPAAEDLIVDLKHDGVFTGTATSGSTTTDSGGAGGLAARIYNLTDANAPTGTTQANVGVAIDVTFNPANGIFASFSADSDVIGPGDTVTFTNTSFTSDPSGFAAVDWDFDNDGITDATGSPVSTSFASCGTNPVTLTVTDTVNGSSSVTNPINVAAPVASFSSSIFLPGLPLILQFNDTSTNSPSTWDWDLDGDGVFGDSSLPNPQGVFPNPGLFTVSMTVTNACGSDTATLTVDTRPQPTVTNTIVNGNTFIGGISYDPSTDEIWVIEGTGDLVQRIDSTGAQVLSVAAPIPAGATAATPVGCAIDVLTGNLWICDETEDIFELDRNGAVIRTWSAQPAIIDASAIAIDPVSRTVFVSNDSGNLIQEFDMSGNPVGAAIDVGTLAGSGDADGLVYNWVDQTLILGEDTANAIIITDRSGNLISSTSTNGILNAATQLPINVSPEGLGIDSATGTLFVGDGLSDEIYEIINIIPAPTGSVTTVGAGCADSGGSIPMLGTNGVIQSNSAVDIAVQTSVAAGANPSVYFLLGINPVTIDLGLFGATGCTLHAIPEIVTAGPIPLNHNNRAGLSLSLGNLAGASFRWQAVLLPDNVPGTISVSNAITTVIQ